MIKTKWNAEAVKAYETGQGVELVNEPYPHYVSLTTESEKQEHGELNYDYVICPACVHQFRAIPENVQRLMIDAGFEPPFTTPKTKEWVSLTDEEMNEAMDYWSDDSRSAYGGAIAADDEYVDMISTWRYIEAKLKEKNT